MNLETSKYCINCGNELKQEQEIKEINPNPIICPECKTENKETAKFCISCGKNLKDTPTEIVEAPIKMKKLMIYQKHRSH